MRHLGSLALALLVTPVVLALAGRGLVGLPEAAADRPADYFGIAASASAVLLAGLLYAWLTIARFSPLGPALAGAACLTLGGWSLADPVAFHRAVPGGPVLTDDQVTAAATLGLLLGLPLLVTMFAPGRWRRTDRTTADRTTADRTTAERTTTGQATTGHANAERAAADPYGRSHLPSQTLDDIPRVTAAPPLPPPAPPPPPPVYPPPVYPAPAPPPPPPPPAPPAPQAAPGDEQTLVLPSDETTTPLRPTLIPAPAYAPPPDMTSR